MLTPGMTLRIRATVGALVALTLLAVAVPAAPASVRRLSVPARYATDTIVRPGIALRISVGRRDRVVRVRLRRVTGGRILAARYVRVRRGRRQLVRFRVSAATARRLAAGRYRVGVRAGRRRGRLEGRTRFATLRLAPRRVVAAPAPSPPVTPPPPPAPAADPVVAAAGDISCAGDCGQAETAALVTDVVRPQAVLGLGDFQYDVGTPATFAAYYTPTWGRFKNITYPINGGGEDSFGTGDWLAYFNEGGPVALQPEGSYSFNVGAWHVVALNSHCFDRASCDEAAWTQWLRADLAAHPARCTLAYWHLPYFTSPTAGDDGRPSLRAWVDVLHAAGVDVLLQAHQHLYERFAPQRPDGTRDDAGGITTFTVGTGGDSHVAPVGRAANSVALNADTYGVLALTLRPSSFDFRFVPEPGKSFADAGSAACH
jgi:acid phosphatase type 7